MPQPTNTVDTYDVGLGNERDLSGVVNNIAPEETPILSRVKTEKASQTYTEWLEWDIPAGSGNEAIEGDEFEGDVQTVRTVLANRTQILREDIVVSGTQQAVNVGGNIQSEYAAQVTLGMKKLKKDIEFSMIGRQQLPVTGNATTARRMGSLDAFTGAAQSSLSTAGTASTAGTPIGESSPVLRTTTGTDREIDDDIFVAAMQKRANNAENSDNVIAVGNLAQKVRMSSLDGNAELEIDAAMKERVQTAMYYLSDFGKVMFVGSRQCLANTIYIINPDYVCMRDLRPMKVVPIAKTGDSMKGTILTETTLVVKDRKSVHVIGDLS